MGWKTALNEEITDHLGEETHDLCWRTGVSRPWTAWTSEGASDVKSRGWALSACAAGGACPGSPDTIGVVITTVSTEGHRV